MKVGIHLDKINQLADFSNKNMKKSYRSII